MNEMRSLTKMGTIKRTKQFLELKNMTELKISIESFSIRFNQAEKRIIELVEKLLEIIQSEEKRKKKRMKKSKESLRKLWNTSSKPIYTL